MKDSTTDTMTDTNPSSAPPEPRIGLRSGAIVLLAVLASLFALRWASAVVVPVLLGLTFSYALTPIVNRLVRLHLPRALASALLLMAVVGAVGGVAWAIRDDAAAMLESLPDVAQKMRREVARQRGQGPASAIAQVQKAAAEIESAAADTAHPSAAPSGRVTRVQIEPSHFNVRDYLWTGTLGLVAGLGHATVVLFVTFFLLASGDTFRRKMIKIAGPGFGQKRVTLLALDEIDHQIQRYLLVQLFTSASVGLAVWLSFWWLGVEHAPVWGALGFVLNFIPYFGSVALAGASALLGFVQFGSFEMALLIGGVSLLITSFEGHVLTPWLTVRTSRMNPVAVFVGVLAWGWLWGLGGLFLGMPILMAIKAVCDRVDEFKAVGELLGD
jgi:predicted PurR-regulated permease PerM